ncbi:uncharacterized protein PRCAT00003214001 [Priceomyces carsonii]|uniref:uncharacterized protein n=1 Tax=Priceomyces carsonii TaxID=28549 RepID=UPI002ED7C4CA|nr:unnamed protein product [Priceomyces carsonii]
MLKKPFGRFKGMTIAKMSSWRPRYYDIGVNFSDPMFQGYYNNSSTAKHNPDLDEVIQRAKCFNVDKILITASTIKESEEHFELCERYGNSFGSTVGVHPCTVAQEFFVKDEEKNEYTNALIPNIDEKLSILKKVALSGQKSGYVKAFGEIGLDYDRLHYSTKEQQISMFKRQLEVYRSLENQNLPLFLHMRNACLDFIDIIGPFIDRGEIKKGNGVVHSFTGTQEDLERLLELGFFIGINGCSLKTDENLKVASLIPKEKLMIETDAAWCEIRKSHAGYKYITSYPNKFYPEIPEESPEYGNQISGNKEQLSAKQGRSPQVKMDEFLPFPSIKKENFNKHLSFINSLMQKEGPKKLNTSVGIFSHPLIKSRNEPVFVGYVAEIMCHLYGIQDEKDIEEFIDLVFENSLRLFG